MLSRLLALLAALVAYAPVLRYGFLINSSICANVSYIYGATSQPSEYPVPAPHEMCDIHGGDPPRTSPSSSWQPFHVFDSVPVPCPLRDALGDGPAHGGPGTSRPCWWWSIHVPSSGYSCSRVSWVILVELCSSLADLLPVGDHPPACEPTSRAITSFDLAPSCSRCIWVIRVELCSLAGSLPLGDHPPTAEPTSRVTIDLTPSFSCYSCVMLVLVELCPWYLGPACSGLFPVVHGAAICLPPPPGCSPAQSALCGLRCLAMAASDAVALFATRFDFSVDHRRRTGDMASGQGLLLCVLCRTLTLLILLSILLLLWFSSSRLLRHHPASSTRPFRIFVFEPMVFAAA
jgi:hypothetical protein